MTATPETRSDDDTDPVSPRRRGQLGLISSLAVVGLVAVAGVAALTLNHGHNSPAPPSSTATPSGATGDPHATGFGVPQADVFSRRIDIPNNPAGQPLPQTSPQHQPTDPDWLTAAPVMPDKGGWQRVHGASAPFSTSDGPTGTVNGVATGWAHTPQGAALAAVYATFQVNARPGDRELHVRLFENPPGMMNRFDADKAAGKIPAQMSEDITRYLVAPDAFKIDNYSDDMAVLEMAVRGVDDNGVRDWLATQVVMVWDGGWKVQPPADANPPETTITSLTGWTAW
jgi:hypothetical protein